MGPDPKRPRTVQGAAAWDLGEDPFLAEFGALLKNDLPPISFSFNHYRALWSVLFNKDGTGNFKESNINRIATIIEVCTPRAEQLVDDKDTVWSTKIADLRRKAASLQDNYTLANLHACLAQLCATWINMFLLKTDDGDATRRDYLRLMITTIGKMKIPENAPQKYAYHYPVPSSECELFVYITPKQAPENPLII